MTYFAAYRRDGETGHTHNIVLLDQGDDFTDPELLDLTQVIETRPPFPPLVWSNTLGVLELTPCLRLINCQVRDKFPMLEEFSECTPKSALFLVKVSVARAQCRPPILFFCLENRVATNPRFLR
jgi:hypothetical protein